MSLLGDVIVLLRHRRRQQTHRIDFVKPPSQARNSLDHSFIASSKTQMHSSRRFYISARYQILTHGDYSQDRNESAKTPQNSPLPNRRL